MKKILFLLLVLPLTVTAVPTDISVTEFFWTHDGVDTASYQIQCNGSIVSTIDVAERSALIPTLPEGAQDCTVSAVSAEGLKAESGVVSFFIVGGSPVISVLVPVAPTFGVR